MSMTEPHIEASDADLAEQALPVDVPADDPAPSGDGITADLEADTADVIDQWRDVPLSDDDYDHR